MSLFVTLTKNKIACICKCLLPRVNVDKLANTMSSLQGIQMLVAAQKHGAYSTG